MADCCNMKEGDVFYCKLCGLELSVKKACACKEGAEDACNVPLQCCNQEMIKKQYNFPGGGAGNDLSAPSSGQRILSGPDVPGPASEWRILYCLHGRY